MAPEPRTAAASTALTGTDFVLKSKKELSEAFTPITEGVQPADWAGTYVDMFSPDYKSKERLPWDMNPKSRRFIDLRDSTLYVSGDLGDGSKWGKRFDSKAEGPIFLETSEPSKRLTNFICNVPPDAPVYADAKAGALQFTVTLGRIGDTKVIRWSSLYNGKGGRFGGFKCPKGDCDNFMVQVDENPIQALAANLAKGWSCAARSCVIS